MEVANGNYSQIDYSNNKTEHTNLKDFNETNGCGDTSAHETHGNQSIVVKDNYSNGTVEAINTTLIDSGIVVGNSIASSIIKETDISSKTGETDNSSDCEEISELPSELCSNEENGECNSLGATTETPSLEINHPSISDTLYEELESISQNHTEDSLNDHITTATNDDEQSIQSPTTSDLIPEVVTDSVAPRIVDVTNQSESFKIQCNGVSPVVENKLKSKSTPKEFTIEIFEPKNKSGNLNPSEISVHCAPPALSTVIAEECNEPDTVVCDKTVNERIEADDSVKPSKSNVIIDTTQRDTKTPKPDLAKPAAEKSPDAPSPTDSPKVQPMAFTVDLGDSAGSDSSGSGQSTKKLDISGPISQFAPPKHRRNLSLSKVEENKKVEDQTLEKPPIGRPRSGTLGATPTKRGGYHSEGYFSSDQEDENNRKELKSPRINRNQDPLRSPGVTRSSSLEPQKSSIRARPESPSNSYTVPLTESANFLIERMITATPETKRKNGGKPEGRSCCKERERKPSVSELTGRSYKDKNSSPKSTSPKPNINDMMKCEDFQTDTKDDASDTGTYTIDKDSPDVDDARQNIENVFGVITESEAELTSSTLLPQSTTDACQDDETSWLSSSEIPKSKINPVLSRNSPNWIQQWADQVAEQTKPALDPTTQRMKPQSPSNDSRPRRMLPTPPARLPSSPARTANKSDMYETKTKILRTPFESLESGESDLEPRLLYDDDNFVTSLRNKLRLAGQRGHLNGDDQPSEETPYDLSDSSSEISEVYKESPRTDNNPPLKFNRAFSLRRARLGCDDTPKAPEKKKVVRPSSAGQIAGRKVPLGSTRPYQSMDNSSVSSPKGYGYGRGTKPAPIDKSTHPSHNFPRHDGGRYSLRLAKSGSTSAVPKSPTKAQSKKELVSGNKRAPRSNSTLSSKEVDFQNWKRRKNYDPMKAAAEGRKKQVERKVVKENPVQETTDDQGSPSPPNTLLRSASFHGTGGATLAQRWSRKGQNMVQYASEDDGPYSIEEETSLKVSSPLRWSPNSNNQTRHPYQTRGARGQVELQVGCESPPHFQATRKVSLDESGSEGKRSPLNSQTGSARGARTKNKMEALDNLVISTIHSLSVKVRTTSESLLLKLKSQYDEEGDRAALLQEVLAHLSESDQSGSSHSRSTSRELAGILRNLKKIEQSLQVIDRVIVDGEYGDDIPDGNEWGDPGY